VTFRLKDEYYSWFDPFQYVSPDQHSQIFQMYEQKQLKGKFIDQGLNDIVGDYKGHYEFATELNYQLLENMARSEIIEIILPLLIHWLKYRKKSLVSGAGGDDSDDDGKNPHSTERL